MQWFYRIVRKYTNPIPEQSAILWKRRLSYAYAFIAWNAFGYVCYMIYTGRQDWAHYYGYKSDEEASQTPAQQWSKTLGIKNATVYRIQGFNVQKYDVHNDFDKDKESKINENSTAT